MVLVKRVRLNEAFEENGDIWINPEQVAAVVGEETATSVRVLFAGGHAVMVAQPQGEGKKSVVSEIS